MEPTTAMVSTVVSYLAKKLKDKKSIQDFFDDFTQATIDWIRPIFLKDEDKYEKIIEDLIKNPDSPIKRGQVEMAVASHLEDFPNDEAHLKAMYDTLQEKATNDKSIKIINSKNVNTGKIKAKGPVTIGNNNTVNTPNERNQKQ